MEFSHLRFTALDASQGFDLALRFFDRRRRVVAKIRFEGSRVFDQRTLGVVEINLFQFFDAALNKQLEIFANRVFRHTD